MNHSYSSAFHKLIRRIEQLRRKIQQFISGDLPSSFYIRSVLKNRYNRCLHKLATLTKPALKAGTTLGLAAILHSSSIAQQQPCSLFHNTVYSNPIKRVSLPYQGLGKPSFVDIDGDGDLDCYEEYSKPYHGTNHGYVIFLRNNGTKGIPYYVQDTATGFPSTLTLDVGVYPPEMDGAVFADLDGDGDYDCLLSSYTNYSGQSIIYFENTGTKTKPVFTERFGAANPFLDVHGYYGLSYALADLDNDGDYDLIATNYAYTRIYTNIGTAQAPKFQETQSTLESLSGHVTVYDWNKDGLIDYFNVGVYYKNVGTATNPVFTPDIKEGPKLPKDFFIYQFADINSDGFVDAFDEYDNYATTSPDAAIQADSINKALKAYPKNASYTYRWQRNGRQIPGATSDLYTPKIPGLYTVEITDSCGSGVSYPYAYKTTQKTLTGEDENSFIAPQIVTNQSLQDASIKSYPNPFASSFVLQLNSHTDISKTTIRITDIEGRIIQTIQPNNNTVSLGSRLARGIYVVQVIESNQVVSQQKMIKE